MHQREHGALIDCEDFQISDEHGRVCQRDAGDVRTLDDITSARAEQELIGEADLGSRSECDGAGAEAGGGRGEIEATAELIVQR